MLKDINPHRSRIFYTLVWPRGGGKITPQRFSGSLTLRNTISTATPMFSETGNTMNNVQSNRKWEIHDGVRQTGNTSIFHELQITTTVSSVLGELGTKFQRLPLGFRGQALQWCYYECSQMQPDVGNSRWRTPNRNYL